MDKILMASMAVLALTACSSATNEPDRDPSRDDTAGSRLQDGDIAMRPGQWQIKMTFDEVEAPGLAPAMLEQVKAQMAKGAVRQVCLNETDAQKLSGDFFGAPPQRNCTFQQLERSGDRMKVAMTCSPGGNMVVEATMDGRFTAESYDVSFQQSTKGTPMGKFMTTGQIVGSRVGDCPA
jgi:hypothetical protein